MLECCGSGGEWVEQLGVEVEGQVEGGIYATVVEVVFGR